MALVVWRVNTNDNKPIKPDKIITYISQNSIVNNGNKLVKGNDFFTSDDMFFPELTCLCEYFKFNYQVDFSVKKKMITESLQELIEKK